MISQYFTDCIGWYVLLSAGLTRTFLTAWHKFSIQPLEYNWTVFSAFIRLCVLVQAGLGLQGLLPLFIGSLD